MWVSLSTYMLSCLHYYTLLLFIFHRVLAKTNFHGIVRRSYLFLMETLAWTCSHKLENSTRYHTEPPKTSVSGPQNYKLLAKSWGFLVTFLSGCWHYRVDIDKTRWLCQRWLCGKNPINFRSPVSVIFSLALLIETVSACLAGQCGWGIGHSSKVYRCRRSCRRPPTFWCWGLCKRYILLSHKSWIFFPKAIIFNTGHSQVITSQREMKMKPFLQVSWRS